MIRNRDQWTIDAVHRNGDLTVTGRTGAIRLPADYVQDSTSSSPTPRPATPPKAAPSTDPSSCSTAPPTSAASTSP